MSQRGSCGVIEGAAPQYMALGDFMGDITVPIREYAGDTQGPKKAKQGGQGLFRLRARTDGLQTLCYLLLALGLCWLWWLWLWLKSRP